MAKKMDPEVLKKNAFWIGLGAFALLWLVAVVIVVIPSELEAKKKYEDAKKEIEGIQGKRPKTPAYQVPWKAHGEAFKSHKDKVWADAWNQQAKMYDWPLTMPEQDKPKYPSDDWTSNNLSRFSREEQYASQFSYLEPIMVPVVLNGGVVNLMAPVVWNVGRAPTREEIWLAQEDYWVRREMLWIVREAVNTVALFRDVTDDVTAAELAAKSPPPKEEKQPEPPPAKDKDAAKDKAKLPEKDKLPAKDKDKAAEKEKPKEQPKPKGEAPSDKNGYRRLFRNANWQLDLRFEKPKGSNRWAVSPESNIKNVNALESTQALANPKDNKALVFQLWQNGSKFRMLVEGEPLQFEQSSKLKAVTVEGIDPTQPFGVEQPLEWQMSPVRRVEALETGPTAQSHRTAIVQLKIREDLKLLDPDPSEAADKDGAAKDGAGQGGGGNALGGVGVGGMGGGKPPGPGGPPNAGGGGGEAEKGMLTPINGINRARYLHVKEQARHLPVAMRLVVDQSHVHDVLSAVANSRLRIQITQVSMHHVRVSQVSQDEALAKDGKGNAPPGPKRGDFVMPKPGFGGPGGAPPPPSMPSGPQGAGNGFSPTSLKSGGVGSIKGDPMSGGDTTTKAGPTEKATSSVQLQDTTQLVELTVYGIATLYERYPPKPLPAATTDPKDQKK